MQIKDFQPTDRFARELRRLDQQMQKLVSRRLMALQECPIPRTLRHHTLAETHPKIHKIDVTSNHSHQITFEVDGSTAVLLRIGTHKEIDRSPR